MIKIKRLFRQRNNKLTNWLKYLIICIEKHTSDCKSYPLEGVCNINVYMVQRVTLFA